MASYCTSPATLRLETLDSSGAVSATLDLMDVANGYRVGSLDVGFPEVRSSIFALPSRDGDYDTTRLYGPRTVTVSGSFIPSSAMGSRQKAMQSLAYWCQPRLRPRVVYALDSDCTPLWLGIRGSQLSAPASNPAVSAFTVSWVAPDPVARSLTASQITINASASGTATNNGTYRAWPVLDIYGPCTNPQVVWTTPALGGVYYIGTIASGHYVAIDTQAQTALLDGGTTSVYPSIDFHNTRWCGLEPGANILHMAASSSSSPARVIVNWADSTI